MPADGSVTTTICAGGTASFGVFVAVTGTSVAPNHLTLTLFLQRLQREKEGEGVVSVPSRPEGEGLG